MFLYFDEPETSDVVNYILKLRKTICINYGPTFNNIIT